MPLIFQRRLVCSALLLAAAAPSFAAKQSARGADAQPSGVEQLNAATATPALGVGTRGEAVVRAQILLDRAWFSPGEIDGHFGQNMRRVLRAYQAAQGLQVSGRLDAATWAALGTHAGPLFTTYTVTAKDAAGPFTPTPKAMADRAKMKSLDYESIEEALGERFHLSPALLTRLNRGKRIEAGTELVVPDLGPGNAALAAQAKSIRIDRGDRVLSVLDAQDKPLGAFPISVGGPGDPLPLGRMKLANEVVDPSFTYDPKLLKSAPRTDAKAEIAPGPNNPVGNVWLGLSKPHWGIHGTPEPAVLGRAETNGCIHMTNWDARRVSTLVKAGFVVDVRP